MTSKERERHGWQIHHGVTVAECPRCGFCFDADHLDDLKNVDRYTCPLCDETPPPPRPTERDEMVCDRCDRRHNVHWCVPSDVWNDVMRDGKRGNPDEFSFCCPTCFMQLADERGVGCGMWVVVPDPFAGPYDTVAALHPDGTSGSTGSEAPYGAA